MGEGRYRTLLCLVQVAVPAADGVRIEVIDPLDDDVDPAPLAAVLADPDVEIVMHAARQDVALLRRVWRTEITDLFDTQVAAGFAGLRAQAGYESLLGDVLGIRLPKSASYTKWDRRPLSAEQVAYAREDVEHLFQLADALQDRLRERGRLEWAREECRFLETVSDERDLDAMFDRLPADRRARRPVAGRGARARRVAGVAGRARRTGRCRASSPTPPWSRSPSASRTRARRSRTSAAWTGDLRRRGDEILDAVARGRDRAPIPFEGERRPAPHPADAPLIALCEALVRTRVADSDLAYELVASRADLQAILAGLREGVDADVRTLQGWRRALVGDELLALLRGERALAIDADLKVRVTER